MSKAFQNISFALCIIGCLLVTALNNYVTRQDQKVIYKTFNSLYAESARANQVMVGQEYATMMGSIAELEAFRAHELEEQLESTFEIFAQQSRIIEQLQLQLSINENIINQLIQYIQGIPVPAHPNKET